MKLRNIILLLLFTVTGHGIISAQGYDDDDIYYNPDKAPKVSKTTKQSAKNNTKSANAIIYYPIEDYPAADS